MKGGSITRCHFARTLETIEHAYKRKGIRR
jgi:hypothetical protein